ncbi:Chromatin structure-remodeling complex subunit [Lachnellula occidentalis]|uniref:Chromatin structure-remodeling complex subunit n=1 Tax=Lachnellula occidentalis TaxID=215460 RepID=A0A8H8UJ68_9HELO|nr:Chromatin structure-remodeling complex subunit [Lachnellula occidentalis]
MYSAQTTNGVGLGDSGTINPAALNSAGALTNPTASITPNTSPPNRGIKRSHSPAYGDLPPGDDLGDDGTLLVHSTIARLLLPTSSVAPGAEKARKTDEIKTSWDCHREFKPVLNAALPKCPSPDPAIANSPLPPQLNSITPTQASPPKTTPSKTVIKALPTVRDHTTDQLGPAGDEYIPREYDEAGEKKVTETGLLQEGREYRCRTFFVPNRGDKLFMLATECARVLGYRDSYLLFNKNRSLYKIIATQAEKEDLIHQEILPFSYRSRQIAIVTAKSMFRQFGSRVIVNGRRVRDDYWETKARKQGFTEEDMAGEKRPGAAKARDAAAAEANATASMALGHHGDIVYSSSPGHFSHAQPQAVQPGMIGAPGSATTLPMITLAPEQPEMRLRDYSHIQRPRQEIHGPAYQDRTQTSPPTELLTHAHQTAEYNKQVNAQRSRSGEYIDRRWRTPHDAPQTNIVQQPIGSNDDLPSTQALHSPRTSQSGVQQPAMSQQNPQHMMPGQSYSQPTHQQTPIAQSPMRAPSQGSMRSDQLGRTSNLPMGSSNLGQGGNPYGFNPQAQMWPPSQPQQSPQHFPSFTHSQQSPHIQQSGHQPSPQLRHAGGNPQMQPALQYPGMQGLGQGYPAPGRGLYQPDQGAQQFMQPSTSGPQAGAQGWAPQQQPGSGGNWGWAGQPQ